IAPAVAALLRGERVPAPFDDHGHVWGLLARANPPRTSVPAPPDGAYEQSPQDWAISTLFHSAMDNSLAAALEVLAASSEVENDAMTAPKSMNPAEFPREHVEAAGPDVLRAMVKTFADALMSAEADALCGAPYGQRSEDRTNSRNGYRSREWDTRAGTVELAI